MKLAGLSHSPLAKTITLHVLKFAAVIALAITLLEVGFFYNSAKLKLEQEITHLVLATNRNVRFYSK